MAVDLAISQKDTADYTAIAIMGKAENGNIYVLDIERERLTFNEGLNFIKQKAAKWNPQQIGIEKIAFQSAVIHELLRTTNLNIKECIPDKDKVLRFQPLAARYEQGLVFHSRDLPLYFEQELLGFPEVEHDDMVDACSYCYSLLKSGGAKFRKW
jgi:predicted phage terminase large subunit-like protein